MKFLINLGYTTKNGFWQTLTDKELTKHDLLTHLNVSTGECDWDPTFGTTIREKLFQAKTETVKMEIQNEIKAVFNNDPRVSLIDIESKEEPKGWTFYCNVSYLGGTPEVWEYEYQVQNRQTTADGNFPS